MPRWIVDASNVMGSRPDGWWRDRDRALRRLVDETVRWRAATGDPVLVVADGSPSARVPEGTIDDVHVRFAHSSARDAADDEIERIVSGHDDPASLTAVTSDRALRSRIERHGASVVGAGRFLEILADIPERRQERAILNRFGAVEADLLGWGGEARVFAAGDDRVVRITRPGTEPASLDARRGLLEHIRRTPLPFATPEVVEHLELEGRLVVVERRLPGRDALEALAERGTDRRTLLHNHLDAAAAIAAVDAPATAFGELWGDGAVTADGFRLWAVARLRVSLDAGGERFSAIDPENVTDALVSALPKPAPDPPRLVHLDAFLGNMLTEADRITAVLDFGPMSIAGPADLDAAVAAAYLASEITPTARHEDREVARAWAKERGLGSLLDPAERWIAAYWTGAPDDPGLQRWCRRILT